MDSDNSNYSLFLEELIKDPENRKEIQKIRKIKFSIDTIRLNKLFEKYFHNLSFSTEAFRFIVEEIDHEEVNFLLREHFALWIEIKNQEITLYKNFPQCFKLIKEVNPVNHWYTPKTFPKGSLMYLGVDPYGVCNRSKGIPLSEVSPDLGIGKIRPIVQINYDFIETF